MSFFARLGAGIKERFRKFLVSIKKKPDIIAMVLLLVSFMQFSLNLKNITATTKLIQGNNMGLSMFLTFLLLLLSFVCALNSFPRREKPKVAMIVLMFVLFAIIVLCDINYYNCIVTAITRAENPIEITAERQFVLQTKTIFICHIVLMCVTTLLYALLPLYSKLLKKINTSISVETNEDMGEIELENDDE